MRRALDGSASIVAWSTPRSLSSPPYLPSAVLLKQNEDLIPSDTACSDETSRDRCTPRSPVLCSKPLASASSSRSN